ncbi:hypothetical protein M440DRAFT_1457068 [Trichoderma longibrachiatum ATCC 18648]|uniref:Protein kinase domain-containing protein n=1 Tax=Trichoderma longibrachiatum ATCC 18648 TaxID=983965 RepID=A0A2T4C3V5_TRILO|nr:hypothetical protein M440DRAFT_1457068 [Trichoderma longibrachiatum ATCC 18648]
MNMASQNDSSTSEFALIKREGEDAWTAIKKTDPDETDLYIALPWSHFKVPTSNDPYEDEPEEGLVTRLEAPSWSHVNKLVLKNVEAVSRIFNHKNIVSIAGSIQADSSEAAASTSADLESTGYMVWDYCAHADLCARLEAARESPDKTIRESLCWHVLTLLLEAITYLHDGKRLVVEGGQRRWKAEMSTWTPILHGKIEPHNVRFQQKRHGEEHGRCKLADFRWAVAMNHKISYGDEADELDEDGGDAASRLQRLRETLLSSTCVAKWPSPHKHSIDSELCSLGRLMYAMMADEGREKEAYKAYSEQLRAVVSFLLERKEFATRFSQCRVERVLPTTKVVMEYFREWKRVGGS